MRSIFGSIRGQLILGVALLNAAMMSLFVWYLTDRQQDMLLQRQTEHAIALASSIATSSSGWLAAQDYSGLQEIIDAQSRYPDLLFAMILDPQGHVLAHSDTAVVGKYLRDISEFEVNGGKPRIISRAAELVDIATPVVLIGRDIGWVRIGLGQKTIAERLHTITRSGIINVIVAVTIGSLAVAFLGWRLTRRLYAIQSVADKIQAGDRVKRVQLTGGDEAAKLGEAFDAMLDTLAKRESELQEHRDHLSELVAERTSELVHARDAAETANKAKSVFLANMSHELRTPLNAILGFSSLIQQDSNLSPEQQEHLNIINRSGEHLLTLINDVLEIAKIEAGKIHLDIGVLDLHEMVRDVIDMMQLRAEQKGIQLKLEQSSVFPRYISSDTARLRQILVNLVGNAVKFTEKGEVSVRLGAIKNKQIHLIIDVEDSGPGISYDDQKSLFRPFVQLVEKGEQKGTGLGLAITKQYVELLDGKISLKSRVGKGSLFQVQLPIEEVDAEEKVEQLVTAGTGVVELVDGQPCYRVLVVEDQLENQLLLMRLMTDIGMEVRLAENGAECLQIYQEWQPDLIWMDRRMPVMDGEEAARRIRKLPGGEKVKIIAVTASAFKEEHNSMLTSGMDEIVSKPYRFNEIYDTMARHLGLEFVNCDTNIEDTRSSIFIKPYMLEKIENEQQIALREALRLLDRQRITEVIQRIGEKDQVLADSLQSLADDFNYPAILEALDALSASDNGDV
jgi:signal transduction histidine kinase/DNA-binding NarL/FixJ family response regulator